MTATIVTLVAAIAGWFVVRVSVDELARRAAVQTPNHRGLPVAATGGVALVLGIALAGAFAALAGIWRSMQPSPIDPDELSLIATIRGLVPFAAGFAFVGLYDDIAGSPDERGWRSHGAALRRGRASAGAVKVVGGAAIALALTDGFGLLDVVTGAAVVAMSANLVNAFDARPLRAIKASGVWLAIIIAFAIFEPVSAPVGACLVVAACLAALWRPERQERIMLGDVGANALGAVLGALTVVTELGASVPVDRPGLARWLILAVLVAMTLVSHRPGFGVVIERVGFLRTFDRLGRQPDPLPGDEAL